MTDCTYILLGITSKHEHGPWPIYGAGEASQNIAVMKKN